jgi:hypothetical protein
MIITVFITGCVPIESETIPPRPSECDVTAYQNLKWLDADVLKTRDLPAGTRVIGPNMAVTMDFRQDRLNFSIGKTNRIERIFCG